ncbi:class I SAM-dependent methyltransferase [Kutzneria sp. CA-103260]|uniref:class I SAM-dependent methyltransferase n=1 Tax=Kutzneria sp. CA-103260 TaxID=2802641 RepID=UPI001BA7BC47|nr:SAM-dependent methyltransferase [Kutzneria sp. CA-103260]QUQ66224.1 class I SAM-dependent methyltransferase [Kutzneria sp. CA-103260]
MGDYDSLVSAAAAVPLHGWDFGWLAGRAVTAEPSWRYPDLALGLLRDADRVLDIDTGGGELLATLSPPAGRTWAAESWPPNVSVASRRLAPLGVTVVGTEELPFPDREFSLVLNRHGRFDAAGIARVLAFGGTVLTQQVGSDDCVDLNHALGAPVTDRHWNLDVATEALAAAGLEILDAKEEWPLLTFHDIGAVVYQLRMVPWQVPDFSVPRYDQALRRLHSRIEADGPFAVRTHRFLIRAWKRDERSSATGG